MHRLSISLYLVPFFIFRYNYVFFLIHLFIIMRNILFMASAKLQYSTHAEQPPYTKTLMFLQQDSHFNAFLHHLCYVWIRFLHREIKKKKSVSWSYFSNKILVHHTESITQDGSRETVSKVLHFSTGAESIRAVNRNEPHCSVSLQSPISIPRVVLLGYFKTRLSS